VTVVIREGDERKAAVGLDEDTLLCCVLQHGFLLGVVVGVERNLRKTSDGAIYKDS
jgi:hypothetical protein